MYLFKIKKIMKFVNIILSQNEINFVIIVTGIYK